ncbi:6-phosphogluconate dehydrogenase [Streptomyces longisporoflavus]|uniref:NAD(P)-dependent oxidoreductase n=1 Tax=Streptomyces longisporoflavus TaxID=28044 RepID=UPI00167D0129|nr:NAD(P)-binding domain-containing protein [Streptomyces longisporoflavus]GGV50253.1 6-phosphogluconate dehydrogenase [Streptomyces longisporoflavus]
MPAPSATPTPVTPGTPVTLIGLGPMGHAMATALLARGHRVTLWNRTASRADDLVARGAILAATPEEAVAANELVILSLTDYTAMYDVLEPAAAALSGRVIVNLSSDTPKKAREAAAWAAGHGAAHLTGGVLVPPSGIGKPGSSTFYSGPREAYDKHRATLEVLTAESDYRGEDAGLAALMYQLNMVIFWTSISSYWYAIALADANGLSATDILPYASQNMTGMPEFLSFYAARIDAGNHEGDVDRLAMGLASMEHVVETHTDAGVDAALPSAVADLFRRGMEAGHAKDSFSSIVELLGKEAPAA